MVRIAIVGDPGSGGTTVLGLLYAAQVRRSAAESATFRFQVAPSSMARVGAVFEQLQAGEFPSHSDGPVEFLYEPHPTLASSVHPGWLFGRQRPVETQRVEWTRASVSDLRLHLENGGFPTAGTRQLEGADVLLLLAPLRLDPGKGEAEDAARDTTLAQACAPPGGSSVPGARSSTRVAFVFSMLDRLTEARRKALGVPLPWPDPLPPGAREALGLRLLEAALPRTRAAIGRGASPLKGEGAPRFFFSWVETEPPGTGRPRLRPGPGGGWEPSYPFEEYVGLMEACTRWAGGGP